ncbi:MAG: PilW family protein [Thiotrichaceae bacterium]
MRRVITIQKGFTLVEIMIAMLIGSLLLTGVYQLYFSSKQANKLITAEAEMQENARFAFSVMTSIIQEAGNFGCQSSSLMTTNSLVKTTSNTFRPWQVIEGWEATGTDYGDTYTTDIDSSVSQSTTNHWLSSALSTKDSGIKSKKDSDIIKVWYTKNERSPLSSISTGVLNFQAINIKQGDILVINDCQTVTFAQVCSCDLADSLVCENDDERANISADACSTPGNTTFNYSDLNQATTEISVLEESIFFVGKRSDSTSGYRSNIPSLYVKHLGDDASPSSKEEILEGVESLQILYGQDTNNNRSPNYYVSANQITDWNKVVSVKVSLLLRSQKNNITVGTQAINFNGHQIDLDDDSSDRYLRRVFTSTISLRNRNFGY